MGDDVAGSEHKGDLERYRSLLRLLAQIHLDPRLKANFLVRDVPRSLAVHARARGKTVQTYQKVFPCFCREIFAGSALEPTC